jgi:glycine/D-amino acid oxidase-like deaminating enzyme
MSEDGAQRLRDLRSGKASCGHLVEQRLKQVMILPVHEGDVVVRILQALTEGEAGEAAAENDHFLLAAGGWEAL